MGHEHAAVASAALKLTQHLGGRRRAIDHALRDPGEALDAARKRALHPHQRLPRVVNLAAAHKRRAHLGELAASPPRPLVSVSTARYSARAAGWSSSPRRPWNACARTDCKGACARRGRDRPRRALSFGGWPAPPRPSSAPPAGTSPPSGTGAARAARSGARSWRRLLAGRPPVPGRAAAAAPAGRSRRWPCATCGRREVARLPTGIGELDRVLGGGIVPGSLVLLGGSPGIGKSTITASALGNLAAAGHDVLYVSGEESAAQVRLRAERLGQGALAVPIVAETGPGRRGRDHRGGAARRVRGGLGAGHARRRRLSGAPGSVGQVREVAGRLMRRGQGARQRRGPRRPRDQGGRAGRARGCSSTWWTACCPSRASASAPTARCAR